MPKLSIVSHFIFRTEWTAAALGAYDAFGSFERQMEEGLADIFDEDDPPIVAVAASASIIGCDLTRIFMDDTKKKKKTGLSFDDKK